MINSFKHSIMGKNNSHEHNSSDLAKNLLYKYSSYRCIAFAVKMLHRIIVCQDS